MGILEVFTAVFDMHLWNMHLWEREQPEKLRVLHKAKDPKRRNAQLAAGEDSISQSLRTGRAEQTPLE